MVFTEDCYNGYLFESAIQEKAKPLDLTATFEKLRNKKSFNLIITIKDMSKNPVVITHRRCRWLNRLGAPPRGAVGLPVHFTN